MIRKLPVIIVPLFLVLSCSGFLQENKNMIKEQDMIKILVKFHMADGISSSPAFTALYKNDTVQFLDSILKMYGYKHKQFDFTLNYYSQHLDKLDKLYDQVLSTLSRSEGDLIKPREVKK